MVRYRSGIAVYNQGEVITFFHPRSDQHTQIRNRYGIRDDDGAGAMLQAPFEFSPIDGLWDFDTYRFQWEDNEPPPWTTDEIERQIRARTIARIQQDDLTNWHGDLKLDLLRRLPPLVTLRATGRLDLSRVRTIPPNATLVGHPVETGAD